MNCFVKSIHYYPVKSLSFSNLKDTVVKKNLGILNDRPFCFSRNIDIAKARFISQNPNERQLNNFLTLKNTPVLNKYKFIYKNKILTLYKEGKKIISIYSDNVDEYNLLTDSLLELESSIKKPIFLLKNKNYPFFDTTHSNNISNTLSLININSIKDFEKKINKKIEFERFRGNIYMDGINAWNERNWLNKTIKINNVLFKVTNHIARCSATNLKPNSDNVTINLPLILNKNYNHIDMGVYLIPLNNGNININDKIIINE